MLKIDAKNTVVRLEPHFLHHKVSKTNLRKLNETNCDVMLKILLLGTLMTMIHIENMKDVYIIASLPLTFESFLFEFDC